MSDKDAEFFPTTRRVFIKSSSCASIALIAGCSDDDLSLDAAADAGPDGSSDATSDGAIDQSMDRSVDQLVDDGVDAPVEDSANDTDAKPDAVPSDALTPEMFGAVGDGITDDYQALKDMAAAAVDGSRIEFGAGRSYCIDRVKDIGIAGARLIPRGRNGVDDIIFRADNLTINLNGARVVHKAIQRIADIPEFLNRSTRATVTPLFLDRCNGATVNGPGGFIGPAATSTHDDGVSEGPCHGICVYGGSNITINDVESSDWLSDGLWVGAYSEDLSNRPTAQNVTTNRCTFARNARQGVSIVGCQGYVDNGSTLRDTGNTSYGWHNPGAGADIEPRPNQTLPTSARFNGTKFIDNTGAVLIASNELAATEFVELFDIEASLDSATLRNREAIAPTILSSTDNLRIVRAELYNVHFRAGGGMYRVEDSRVVVDDPRNALIARTNDPTFIITGTEFRFEPATPTTNRPIQMAGGSFDNNTVYVAATAHSGAQSQILARFDRTSISMNQWRAPANSGLWRVLRFNPATTDTDTYTGPVE